MKNHHKLPSYITQNADAEEPAIEIPMKKILHQQMYVMAWNCQKC